MAITPDSTGSPISVTKLVAENSYTKIPYLLQRWISSEYMLLSKQLKTKRAKDRALVDKALAWADVVQRIDYTYEGVKKMFDAFWDDDDTLKTSILADVAAGKFVAFKPNWTIPLQDIDSNNGGPGVGWGGSTAWPFMAALLRYFHVVLGIKYSQMLVADGPDKQEFDVSYLARIGLPIASTAILEGRVVDVASDTFFYGGYGFYWVRKYLRQKQVDDGDAGLSDDNPENGYAESVLGTYAPPGQTSGLFLYDLNQVNEGAVANARARQLDVPSHTYRDFPKLWFHKVIVGDPQDSVNYPGSCLINVAKMKVHPYGYVTLAMKNMIGLPPQAAGHDVSVQTTDYLYGYPAKSPGVGYTEHQGLGTVIKATTPHDPHYVPRDKNGVPIILVDGGHPFGYEYDFRFEAYPGAGEVTGPDNCSGIESLILDCLKTLDNEGVTMLHLVDGVLAANAWHEASEIPSLIIEPVNEGLMFVSGDPVALDKMITRYMFKKVSRDKGTALLTTDLYSGTGDSLTYSAGVVTLVDAAASFEPDVVKKKITISGATNGGNNGSFIVSKWVDENTIEFPNASGVTETSAFSWNIRFNTTFLQVTPSLSYVLDGSNKRIDEANAHEDTVDVMDWRTAAADEVGLGDVDYYVLGRDMEDGGRLISLDRHFGRLREDDTFEDLITSHEYKNITPMQVREQSVASWLKASDDLTEAIYASPLPLFDFTSAEQMIRGHEVSFDSGGDGRVSSLDYPKAAYTGFTLGLSGHYWRVAQLKMLDNGLTPSQAYLKGGTAWAIRSVGYALKAWNESNHYGAAASLINTAYNVARDLALSDAPVGGNPDLFPNTTWGHWFSGTAEIIAWPTVHMAVWITIMTYIYGGPTAPSTLTIAEESIWGAAWAYAFEGEFGGDALLDRSSWPYQTATDYLRALAAAAVSPLVDFVVKVPAAYYFALPHTASTAGTDAFNVTFNQPLDDDYEVWPDAAEWPALSA